MNKAKRSNNFRLNFTHSFALIAASLLVSGEALAWHGRYYGHYYVGPRVVVTSGWHGGYWSRGWHGSRYGWWWVVGPGWYYYDTPIYPYPATINTTVVAQAPVTGPAPAQSWYWCANPAGYYPYVSECPAGWTSVPATPPAPPEPAAKP